MIETPITIPLAIPGYSFVGYADGSGQSCYSLHGPEGEVTSLQQTRAFAAALRPSAGAEELVDAAISAASSFEPYRYDELVAARQAILAALRADCNAYDLTMRRIEREAIEDAKTIAALRAENERLKASQLSAETVLWMLEKAEAELARVRVRTQVPEELRKIITEVDQERPHKALWACFEWVRSLLAQDAQGAPEPAREAEALLEAEIERKAQEIYESWSDQPGYMPWHPRGNSYKQYEARRQARAALGGTP